MHSKQLIINKANKNKTIENRIDNSMKKNEEEESERERERVCHIF